MLQKAYTFTLCILFTLTFSKNRLAHAQAYVSESFQFLRLALHPRSAALGSTHFTFDSQDAYAGLIAPALTASDAFYHTGFGIQSLRNGVIHSSLVSTIPLYEQQIALNLGLQYIHYGKMQETDASGQVVGEFQASEYAIRIGSAHAIGNFRMGVQVQWMGSQIAYYRGHALASTWNVVFVHPDQDWRIGILLSNLGWVVQPIGSLRQQLPFDARLGTSFKPEHMPVRFYLTLYRLNDWQQSRLLSGASEWLSHLSVGSEFLLHRAFHLLIGYQGMQQQSLRFEEFGNRGGWSLGLRFMSSRFEFSYALSTFHISFPRHFWGIQLKL